MSVDQLPPGKARPQRPAAQFVRYGEYIDQQIESTRRNVKVVDVLTALLTIVVGALGFLLVAAVVEHWVLPGGYNVALRLVLFTLLFTSLTFYTTRKLWPLVRGSINPAYAAQAIEQDNPTLKNSLLNLLLFRQNRDDVTDAVYETLEEQAATRLHRVPIDAAVDRTHLLRLGYALIAILAVAALYKILSPKDPFASAERVLMPWARIAAPSRVSIENIEPGHVTLARGEMLTVAADVRGIGADDPVVVKFTTADGQAVDRPAAMKPDMANLRFTGKIPPEGDRSLGVAQDLRYYIEAGDAQSLEYKVTVVSAPTITVERVEYDYPEYTGFADRGIDRLGDIRAIVGTKVTIHARANQSIGDAAIDFQADGRRDVTLTAEGEQARGTFTLALREDGETPTFTSYVLRFTGSDGRPNRDPVKYPIDVVPDFRPEAAILAPKEKTRDVRLDETVAIEIEARDPDFALADVRLTGESAGRTIFNEQLLAKQHHGRFAGRLMFTPGEHDLHAGDVVRYWVTVRDNRAPQANEATTDSQTFRIVGPDPRQPGRPPQDRIAQRDERQQGEEGQQQNEQQRQQEQQGQEQDQQSSQEQSSAGQTGQSGGEAGDPSQGGEQGESQESGESSSSEGNAGDSGEQGSADQSNENGQGENSQNRPDEQQSGGAGESSASEQGGESGQGEQRQGGKQESGGNQSGDPQQGPQDGAQADSQSSQENGQGSQHDAQRGGEDAPARGAREGSDSSPVSSEGDNDSEAFERIQNFLKEQGQLPKESEPGQKQESGESSNGESSEGEAQSGQADSAGQQQREAGGTTNDTGSGEETSTESGQQLGEDSQDGDANRESQGEQPGAESQSGSDSQSGAEAQTGDTGEKTNEPTAQNNQQQPGGGQKTQSEGESGAGNQAEQGEAPPDSPGEKSTEEWQQNPSGENHGEQQSPDAGRGERRSDSHGEQGGEQTGAAEENNAQKSERDGTGGSGQNQSADEGMGESSEQGAGRNSSSGGQDAQANERTGQSSENMQGEGSQRREGQGDKPGGEQGGQQGQQREQQGPSQGGKQEESQQGGAGQQDKQQGEQGRDGQQGQQQKQQTSQSGGEQGTNDSKIGGEDAPARAERDSESKQSSGARQPGSSTTDGAGRVPEGAIQPSGATGEAPGADAANLEYARKQTDLVLETLADQMKRQQVDQRLLDKLGWTEADMKRFVERWQQLKAAANENNPDANEAQRELDDALRSLGLRRGELRQSNVTDDQNRNLRQGYRGAVPLEYQERLRAYNQGVSRARQSDD